jgi:hypothetical protein
VIARVEAEMGRRALSSPPGRPASPRDICRRGWVGGEPERIQGARNAKRNGSEARNPRQKDVAKARRIIHLLA